MIDAIAGFLQQNLVLFLAVVVLPLKWTIVRICRDKEAEGAAIMAVPEDLTYVGIGLVLGDVINSKGAFHHHFEGSQHVDMDLVVTVILGLGVAVLIHLAGQLSISQFKGWRAAIHAATSAEAGRVPNSEANFRMLMVRPFFLFLTGYAIQLAIILPWLRWIARVINQTPAP